MGKGKTSAAINYINSAPSDKKFLFITPYVPEAKRICKACESKQFLLPPEDMGTVTRGVKYLLSKGANIASTHAMFHYFDEEAIDLAYNNNYTLIMDEVVQVINPLGISKYDRENILEKYAHLDDNHIMRWDEESYMGEYEKYKRMCSVSSIGVYDNIALWLFPVGVFRAFREIFILTYFFPAQTQKYYFDMHGIQYKFLYVDGDSLDTYHFTADDPGLLRADFKSLVHICNDDGLNAIGGMSTALSKSWYERNKDNNLMRKLKNNTQNYFRNIQGVKSNKTLWTCFKDYRGLLSGKGYAKGYLNSSARATNEFRDRDTLAYMVNKYFNPYIKNFFEQNGVEVYEDTFAISEMVQWIWRSAIRDGKEIWIYIPSSRMRQLLKNWLDEVSV